MKTLSLILALTLGALTTATVAPAFADTYVAQPGETVQRGKIISVKPVQITTGNNANKTGAAIVGGLAGAILGNQFGKGGGKTLMTGAGAVGGAMLGSKLADGQSTRVSHQWTIRFKDGSTVSIVADGNDLYVGQSVNVVQSSAGVRIVP
jgi:outer membrane lipoprotein SlyB